MIYKLYLLLLSLSAIALSSCSIGYIPPFGSCPNCTSSALVTPIPSGSPSPTLPQTTPAQVPPKVDILLVENDTGSMYQIYPQVTAQIPVFLQNLENSGWDYHFATVPLSTYRSIDQVVGSIYDPNWGAQWVPPFHGATLQNTAAITAQDFSTPANYTGFLSLSGVYDYLDGSEPAFTNIANELYNATPGTGFLRKDAMLVVLLVSNGDDTSLVNYCVRDPSIPNDILVPCEQALRSDGSRYPACTSLSQAGVTPAGCGSESISLQYYVSQLQGLKNDPNLLQFYSIVSNEMISNSSCIGGNAIPGVRFQQMASALHGQSYDICNGGNLSDILGNVETSLKSVVQSTLTHYLPIASAAIPSTIIVTRNDGTVIPEDPVNGWSYSGVIIAGYIIDYPANMDQFTGYAVELNGSARLTGSQTATVTYTPLAQ